MINFQERLDVFIDSLYKDNDKYEFMDELEKYATENNVPIIKKPSLRYLFTIAKMKKPNNILEIGTAIGYSTLALSKASQNSKIITLESYEKRIEIAKQNFKKYDNSNQITLIEGDATNSLEKLVNEGMVFDFIFLDAAKAQYINWLPMLLKLMKNGSVLVADNILQDKCILESRFLIDRRDRTIHERMREFLKTLVENKDLSTSVIPIGDGLTVSVLEINDDDK